MKENNHFYVFHYDFIEFLVFFRYNVPFPGSELVFTLELQFGVLILKKIDCEVFIIII